ncbi:hypothetical protein LCGC14_1231010 [marine sediment metagenome]|uniref:Uncharacterized protein n=1 Tax=marine sediment metagenome TaxID=412755 RepID=A0A0F9L8I2_9ZZZZ
MSTTKTHDDVATMEAAIQAYIDAGNPLEVPRSEIAGWIVFHGLYDVPYEDKLKKCGEEVAKALNKASVTNARGNKARRFLSARLDREDENGNVKQKPLWDLTESCSAYFAHTAAEQMRNCIAGDCRSLNNTVVYANANNLNLADDQIQIVFDFTTDVNEQ